MLGVISKSINRKLVILILTVTILPIVIMTTIGVINTISILETQQKASLNALLQSKEKAVVTLLEGTRNEAESIALLGSVIGLLENKPDYNAKLLKETLEKTTKINNFPGVIIYSASQSKPVITFGLNSKAVENSFANSKLESFCQKVTADGKAMLLDCMIFQPTGKPAMFIGAPVFSNGKQVLGVALLMVNIQGIDDIMLNTTGLGDSGETFLIGEDGYLRSSCRKRHDAGIDSILKFQVKEKSRSIALSADQPQIQYMVNSHDAYALVCLSKIDLHKIGADFNWGICAEINKAELMMPILGIIYKITLAALIMAIITGFAGFLVARSVSKPLSELTGKLVKLADGDLTMPLENVKREDELGQLMNAFNRMLTALRSQTSMIQQGASELASAIVQITAAVSELAANSTETSTSITEISTTMEEVKQTTHVAADKASYVSETASRVSSISDEGTKATREAVSGMNHIKAEMTALAESIVKLSSQTQSIGEIISTVSDLAEQSNLLAVNAAIEAAKAGEFGKGFAVVAQEIKSLADQSKNSTRQVANILNDIQQATSSAVMATERSNKAVDSGVDLSETAGDSIGTLSESIAESASATSQIAASSRQQLIGIDQLATALDSIREATNQSLQGIKQLEDAAKSMKDLSEKFKVVTEEFKLK